MDDNGNSVYKFELPIVGSSNSDFLKMGVEFGPFGPDDKFRGANLLPGWDVKHVDKLGYSFITDNHNRPRAKVYIKNFIHMTVINRFSISEDCYIDNINENVRFCVWDHAVEIDSKPKAILEGNYSLPNKRTFPDVYEERKNKYKDIFFKEAEEFLKKEFPKWQDPTEYWD